MFCVGTFYLRELGLYPRFVERLPKSFKKPTLVRDVKSLPELPCLKTAQLTEQVALFSFVQKNFDAIILYFVSVLSFCLCTALHLKKKT